MKIIKAIVLSLVLVAVTTACDKETDYVVTIKTPFGDMVAVLFDETPLHKENFIKLAESGQFDSTIFHRVMDEFMVQGGDVNRKPGSEGSIDYTIPAEFIPKFYHRRGALAAARQPDQVNPNRESSGCQFYVVQGKIWSEEELTTDLNKLTNAVATLIRIPEYDSLGQELISAYNAGDFDRYNELLLSCKPLVEKRLGQDVSQYVKPERLQGYTTIGGAPWLDDQYTVFGQVIQGLEVVDKIAAVQTNPQDNKPFEDIFMDVDVEEMPRKKITKLYGIEYSEE